MFFHLKNLSTETQYLSKLMLGGCFMESFSDIYNDVIDSNLSSYIESLC